jgi:hypothetical protein
MNSPYDKFFQTTISFIENCKLKIKLFHLHFTIAETNIKQIVLNNGEILTIHSYFLPKFQIQRQTVYKTANMDRIFEVAKELYAMSDQFTLIGEKLEVIVNFNSMIEHITELPSFVYIEIHLNNLDFKTIKDQKQLLSFSIKKSSIAGSVRYFDCAREAIEQKVKELLEFYNIFRPLTVEIAIYDNWTKNIELDWKQEHDVRTVEEVYQTLNDYKIKNHVFV